MVTSKQKLKYYKKKAEAKKIILANVKKKKHTIYGARAINAHLPTYLDKPTQDYDIFSRTPKKTANRVEKRLDKHYGGDYFEVKEAQHPGTYKLMSKVTLTEVADYTKPEGRVPFKTIRGHRYVTLGWTKKQIKKTLDDKKSEYRHKKDKEALQRIRIFEKLRRR